ncbi:hypothetical protein [Deinococcus hohokamensis]|uniref:Uncharacterized protein n=1 Tax=Deinococcus hohokamensis TaxID=309883 RepID=A0ABV9I4G2_9DEIO
MRRILFALLLAPLAAAAPLANAPKRPTCAVQARAAPEHTPGLYIVQVEVVKSCPVNGYAEVRLESYVGGHYPRRGWFEVTKSHPLVRRGVLWYWRGRLNGTPSTPFVIPGMSRPFSLGST